MTDAQRALLTDRQLELAFLGLYEQHKNDVGTAATLVQIQVHIFALAERLEASEQSAKLCDALCAILQNYVGETGVSESAVEVLQRKLQQLETAEETNRIAALAMSETEAWIKILEKERKV